MCKSCVEICLALGTFFSVTFCSSWVSWAAVSVCTFPFWPACRWVVCLFLILTSVCDFEFYHLCWGCGTEALACISAFQCYCVPFGVLIGMCLCGFCWGTHILCPFLLDWRWWASCIHLTSTAVSQLTCFADRCSCQPWYPSFHLLFLFDVFCLVGFWDRILSCIPGWSETLCRLGLLQTYGNHLSLCFLSKFHRHVPHTAHCLIIFVLLF